MAAWSKPGRGFRKLNVKGVFNRENMGGAVGCIIRDTNGAWVRGGAGYIGLAPPIAAELWALFYGLKLVWEMEDFVGSKHFIVECDCESALLVVLNPNPNYPFATLVDWINALLREAWDSVELTLIDEGANNVATTLATVSLDAPGGISVLMDPPQAIEAIIDDEA